MIRFPNWDILYFCMTVLTEVCLLCQTVVLPYWFVGVCLIFPFIVLAVIDDTVYFDVETPRYSFSWFLRTGWIWERFFFFFFWWWSSLSTQEIHAVPACFFSADRWSLTGLHLPPSNITIAQRRIIQTVWTPWETWCILQALMWYKPINPNLLCLLSIL